MSMYARKDNPKMSKNLNIILEIMLYTWVLGSSLGLAGCVPARSAAQSISLIPTPDTLMFTSPLDKPTWIVGEQQVYGFLVTPLPTEKVHIGTIVEFAPQLENQKQPRYIVREDILLQQPATESGQTTPIQTLFVHDSETGQEVRLGDDAGDALFQVMTNQYIIWRYQWDGKSETARKTGMYAYVLETGDEIVIAQDTTYPLYPEVVGPWVVYTDAYNNNVYFANARVHNLVTGEDFLLEDRIPYYGRPSSDYYAISSNKVAWMDGGWTIHTYDLETHEIRTLNILDGQSSAGNVSISGDIVVWWDRFWHGYDLQQDTLFTIPTIPPGWENVPTQPAEPVTVRDGQLYWALSVNGAVYHFTAPIVNNQ